MRKRILSLALAICMVAALLPAAVVTAGAAGETYEYAFNPLPEKGTTITDYTYDKTGGKWAFAGSASMRSNATAFPLTYNKGGFTGIQLRSSAASVEWWIAFELDIPLAGTYAATLGYGEYNLGDSVNVYVLPAGTAWADIQNTISDDYKLNTNVINTSSTKTAPDGSVPVSLEETFETAVDNEKRVLVIKGDPSNANAYAYFSGVTLVRTAEPAPSYTVTYNANGGDTTPDAESVKAGAITLPAAITKDGFTFKGWSDGTTTYDAGASYTVSGAVTLTAVWEAVDGYTFVYDLNPGDVTDSAAIDNTLDYMYTSGMSEFAYRSGATPVFSGGVGISAKATNAGDWFAIKINVPVAGNYAVSLNHRQNVKAASGGGHGDIYVFPAGTAKQTVIDTLGTDAAANYKINKTLIKYQDLEGAKNGQVDTVVTDSCNFSAGEHIVVFYAAVKGDSNAWMYPHVLTLTTGAEGGKKPAYVGCVELRDNTIALDGTTTASAKVWNAVTGDAITTGIVYTSDDTGIATVSGTTVTGAKEGSTKIGATYTGDITAGSILKDDITVEYAEKLTGVGTFGVYQQGGDDADITITNTDGTAFTNYDESEYVPGNVGTAALGKDVILTAAQESVTGAKFAYWKRGKQVVSYSETITYKLNTNTALIAVYDNEKASSKTLELWSANGALLEILTGDEITAEAVAAVQPTLTGYAFLNKWYVAEDEELDIANLTKAVTRAVAQHSETGVAVGDKNYGDLVAESAEGATYWTRVVRGEEKIVAYGSSYKYYVWDETEIKSYTDEVEAKPVVVLDDYANGAYMIEYSVPSGYTKIEAGILYGFSGEPTIGAANSKAVSERSDRHGQLTAAPSSASERVVRGYLIYRDGSDSSRRVIYTDVVTIGE